MQLAAGRRQKKIVMQIEHVEWHLTYRSAAQLVHGWPGSNAEQVQTLMNANQATVKRQEHKVFCCSAGTWSAWQRCTNALTP